MYQHPAEDTDVVLTTNMALKSRKVNKPNIKKIKHKMQSDHNSLFSPSVKRSIPDY